LGTKETGQIVPVAEGTVRNQRSFILEKTGSRSIAHTVFRASELDLFGERLEESLSPPVLRFPESYKEHLGFIAFGFSGEEVEALLGLTRSARRRRVERMRHLLGARNIPHAVRIGAERELI
jgi:DNA-binding CsgD family transcriptional regulator